MAYTTNIICRRLKKPPVNILEVLPDKITSWLLCCLDTCSDSVHAIFLTTDELVFILGSLEFFDMVFLVCPTLEYGISPLAFSSNINVCVSCGGVEQLDVPGNIWNLNFENINKFINKHTLSNIHSILSKVRLVFFTFTFWHPFVWLIIFKIGVSQKILIEIMILTLFEIYNSLTYVNCCVLQCKLET